MNKNDNLMGIAASIALLTVFFSLFVLSQVQAASSYDQQYSQWKQKQFQPQRPIKQNDYYLGKPTLKAKVQKISINQASIEELQQLEGVGGKKAQDIIEFRLKNGPFKSIEELQNVKGIGAKLLEKNRDRLSL